ncbi:hypothetical protein M9458_007254, partial [Cirrhinus mrigala]
MAAVSNVIAFGLLYMRPLQWCLKTKGVSPRGNLLCMIKVTRRCLRALDMWRRPWFFSLSPRNASDGRVPHRLGNGYDGHHPAWHFSCLEMLAVTYKENPDSYGPGPLRAGPSGEERGPPHSSVPVSPQCPREISLPTLPVFQGAAVSSEPTPQSSARKRSGAGELATPAGVSTAASSAVSCRSSVTGHRTAQTTPEASLKRLVPLVDYLAAWKLLPNVSAWVLRTIERGYRIQFGAPPPFNGVFPTVVSPEQGLVMEQEVGTP